MRKQKIDILKNTLIESNASGEEIYAYVATGYIVGKVAFQSGTDNYGFARNDSETVVKIFCENIYDVRRQDRLLIDGVEWLVSSVPEKWINDRGYRNAFVITATYVEG